MIGAGGRELPGAAVRAGVADFLARHGHLVDEQGRRCVVRHGTLPEREVMTGTGRVRVEVPRVRDRKAGVADGDRIGFRSSIMPPYPRKAKSGGDLPHRLHLKGIPPGDFGEAPVALPGTDAEGPFSSTGPGRPGRRNRGPGVRGTPAAGVSCTYGRTGAV